MDGINRIDHDSIDSVVQYWNGEADGVGEDGVWIMNYSQLVHIMDVMNPEHGRLFHKIKIAVFDECHAIYSDNFIEGMMAVRMWIRERVVHGDVLCIGLTATPDIMYHYALQAGIKTKMVNRERLVNYRAKNMICTKFECLPSLIESGRLPGITIIMCVSVGDCNFLRERIPNSVMLCSASNSKHNDEMTELREYIVEHGRLPPYIDTENTPLNVLITTSTMREGVNILPESNIKNVVCCLSDELHVKQFVGRCRFNVENLIIAHRRCRYDNMNKDSYLAKSRRAFEDFLWDENRREWFDSISDIVECKAEDVVRIEVGENEYDFRDRIDEVWACPEGSDWETERNYLIYKEEDKQDLVDYAFRCRLLGKYWSQYSFNAVIKYLEDRFGYEIESGRTRIDGDRVTYKLIHERTEKDYDE